MGVLLEFNNFFMKTFKPAWKNKGRHFTRALEIDFFSSSVIVLHIFTSFDESICHPLILVIVMATEIVVLLILTFQHQSKSESQY